VPNCKSFLVTEAERKHVRRRAQFQQRGDASSHEVIFPARQGAEGNSRHSNRNIRGTYTIVCTVKNWVAQFKVVIFPPVPWTEKKKIERSPFFAEVIAAVETWLDGQPSENFF